MLLYGASEEVCDWVSEQLFGVTGQFDLAAGIGVTSGSKLIAGIVYNNMHTYPDGTPHMIEMSIASVDKRWCNRHNLKALFSYPFTELGLRRVQTHCSSKDEEVIMFNQRLGFKQEGLHREFWPLGGGAISWGMLKSDCRWL